MRVFRPFVLPVALWRGALLLPATAVLPWIPAAQAQPTTSRLELRGTVRDADGHPIEQASVLVEGQNAGATTDPNGRFKLTIPRPAQGQSVTLVVRRVGSVSERRTLTPAQLRSPAELNFELQADQRSLGDVTVRGRRSEDTREQVSLTQIDPRVAKEIPSPFGDFSAVLKTLPGVQSNNELTSTYSVRGGNYDENLVYVNNIEIYRPFLVTAAQQEGLSFVNPDLVERVEFASGGWQPRYGDKLSSVLNIDYKQPTRRAYSGTASLVGGSLHYEDVSKNGRVSYLGGVRYKNAQYVLRSLRQNQGQYDPTFVDAQGYVTVALGPKDDLQRTTLGILGSIAHNDYRFVPVSGQATISSGLNQFLRVFIGYDGHERMKYDTFQGGINLTHHFSSRLTGELIVSGLYSREEELRDIEAAYRFAEINRDPKSPDFNQAVRQRDVGSRFDHSRNALLARVGNVELRQTYEPNRRHTIRWGLKAGRENIHDQLNEYSFVDSADYVVEGRSTRLVTDLTLSSERYQGYAQHTWRIDSLKALTYGVRLHYWSVNQQLTVSPRLQFSAKSRRNPQLSYKLATGVYYQPPFYRELRNLQGQLNPELRAQRSLHFIGGTEYRFKHWGRPFQFTGEAYYKYLTDVVPYDVDNVRLRYFAKNNAKAYAAGADFRLSGEFVRGTESWFSLGVLTTRENIEGDSINTYDADGNKTGRVPKGYIRRPTDQRLNLGIFFQDHLPDNPTVRGYVNLVFGTGLPFSPPYLPDERGTTRLTRTYKRVDMGVSKVLSLKNAGPRRVYQPESLWMGLEVLNILAANNVAGYSYVQDLNGRTYAIPNYLSQRVVNLRVIARF